MEINTLNKRWVSLFPFDSAGSEFDKISQRYSEKNRFYHTLNHIRFCLNMVDDFYDKIDHPDALEIAIWFHDVIYDPKISNNEALSAEYASEILSGFDFQTLEIDRIKQLIMCTRHPSLPKLNDEKYLVDIDLAILGTHKEQYAHYSDSVRKEYAHLSFRQYAAGRKKVLETFINSEFIFYTDVFREKYESLARVNIEKELNAFN
jgi:predicted metal-dependent HD superfamily phosphohydrolase